jgi:G3E family GTPase
MENTNAKPIPTYILSGFLGSGKTTLLRKLIDYYTDQGLTPAVLMNELGEVNIDGSIIGDKTPMKEILNGCICCTVKGDLAKSLQEIADEYEPDVIFIESTGIANPMEVVDTASDLLLVNKIHIKSIITVVNGPLFLDLNRRLGTKGKKTKMMIGQMKVATHLIVNKIDLLSQEDIEELQERIRIFNSHANQTLTSHCAVEPMKLLESTDKWDTIKSGEGEHDNHDPMIVYTYYFNTDVDRSTFEQFLRQLPDSVVRSKGFVTFKGSSDSFLFQYAYGETMFSKFNPTLKVPKVAVFIGESLDAKQLQKQMESLGI